ncbi:type II toxin-antitoxin system RelE/ParE family toxin [Desulfobacca acetoxidans]|uniref:Addiction module toxin, RelE/StbE family n=1 Tax=Desulfobacca acetoxidans (strain ATCC 700848 / DSM 11109 / ASRB2) TaxID=880072 RepID=F2NIU6_DESAR|nr:type II toxin-antitoxin system YafQ family toxin [Desulfobacca acetoxidans]AEB10640.1 addiction module toxin, RelE/StbE family [Desulfobacca acetoxidans DSM 11109]
MIELVWGPKFKRVLKKMVKQDPDLKEKLIDCLRLFVEEPFHPSLKTHKLGGALKGNFAFSLGYDLRVVFQFLDKNEVLLETMGTHDEVY